MPKRTSPCREGVASPYLTVVTLVLSLAFAPMAVADAADRQYVTRPDTDLLLLSVELDRVVLSEAVPAYTSGSGVLIPLGELCRLLSIAVETDPASGTASGFILQRERTLDLDADLHIVKLAGQPQTFGAEDVEVHEDDIYVRKTLLERWLPVTLFIDLRGSRIVITAREPLPLQARRKREQDARQSLAGRNMPQETFPLLPSTYDWLGGPFIDQTLRFTAGRHLRDLQYTTLLTGDLMRAEIDAYLAGSSDDQLSDSRATLSRKDTFGGLLGSLHAREAAIGDVLVPGDDILLLGSSGWGALLSNYPLFRQSQFDKHTFRGPLTPGWEVELYQDGALVAYQQARPDGLYEFADVPLLFGPNEFRLIFYGPRGERREEVFRFNVGETLAPRGRTYYRLAGDRNRLGEKRAIFELEHGLKENVSASATLARAEIVTPGSGTFGRLGVSGFWRSLFAHVDLAGRDGGGSAVRGLLQSRIGYTTFSVQHAVLRDFTSEAFRPVNGDVHQDSRVRFDDVHRIGDRAALAASLDVHRQQLTAGGTVYEIAQRLSGQVSSYSLSNQINARLFRNVPSVRGDLVRGALLLSRYFGAFSLRGEAGYEIEPDPLLQNIALTAETFRLNGYLVQAGVNRSQAAGMTTYLVNVNRLEGRFAGGISASYSTLLGTSVSVNLFASLARDPRSGRWVTAARTMASTGAVSPLVFLDANANGVRDPGEEPLPNVGFFVDRASSSTVTDEAGMAFLTGLTPYQPHNLAVSTATLEDPLLVPTNEGIQFVPRPGKAQTVDFPVIATGEVTGTVYSAETKKSAPGVRLQLVSLAGQVAAETRTSYDGYYEFTRIPPGRYAISVAPDQASRFRIAVPSVVAIAAGGTVIDGRDITVERIASETSHAMAYTVRGRIDVCDASGRKPAAGVTVTLFGPQAMIPAASASDGTLLFERVPAGTYLVVIDRNSWPGGVAPPRRRIVVAADTEMGSMMAGCGE